MDFNNELFATRMIHAIDDGLELSREESQKNKVLNNDLHFSKVNNIGNSIIEMMQSVYETEFKIVFVKRGSYKLFGIFHIDSATLITVMSESNIKHKMDRSSKNPHYLDGYAAFNEHLNLKPKHRQLGFDECLRYDSYQLEPIKKQMIDELEGKVPEAYYTIVFNTTGLRLIDFRIVMLNEFKEEVSSTDWSHLIDADYNEDYSEHTAPEPADDDLGITIKANIIDKNAKLDITLDDNDEKKEKGDTRSI